MAGSAVRRKRTAAPRAVLKITESVRAQLIGTAIARVCLAAEAAAQTDEQFVPHFLILVAALFSKPSPKVALAFGAYGPAGVVDECDILYVNYMEPGPEDVPSVFHSMWRVGQVTDVVDVLSGICEAAGLNDAEAQGVLDMVFKHWVKVDKLRDPASAINLSEVLRAQEFALKPGEKEKTEDQREKDGY